MNMYFLQIPGYPYAFSILGNVFSHQKFLHLAANMAGLAIYGITGKSSSCYHNTFIPPLQHIHAC